MKKPEIKIETRDLTPDLWPAYEKLFGSNGACGGCWCMAWRVKDGERWDEIKGATAKRRMKTLIQRDAAHGVLAFAVDARRTLRAASLAHAEPVGWCSYGPRLDYPKLGRARSLACDDAERVWSLPCFFIKRGWRGKGVATALLAAALEQLRLRGAEIAEGYPVKPSSDGQPLPAAFAWTGTRGLFEAHGFQVVGNPDGAKQRVRLVLTR